MRMSAGRRIQSGLVMLEALLVLVVATIAGGVAYQQYGKYLDRITNKQAADHAQLVAAAGGKYLKDNYAAVLASAGPTTPAVITVPMLINTKHLPTGFSDRNVYGQTYSIQVLEPQPNQLQALVVTTGGQEIPELDGRRIAQLMGANGGFISSVNPTVATGSFGGWEMPIAPFGVTPGAGHIATALFVEDGALVNDYLHRSTVPGHPEVNAMNTAINMQGNNVNNAGTVAAKNVTASEDVTATGWLRTTGDTGWYNKKWDGGWYMSDPTWVRSYGDKNVTTGGEMRAGVLRSTGRTAVGEYLQLDGLASEGTSCSPNGLLGRNAAGLTLSCQSGVWVTMAGSGTNGWTFDVGGIPFYGVGDISGGLFSGNMKCVWSTCGGFGYVNCGSDAGCAAGNGSTYTHYNFRGYTVGARNMAVNNAVKIW